MLKTIYAAFATETRQVPLAFRFTGLLALKIAAMRGTMYGKNRLLGLSRA